MNIKYKILINFTVLFLISMYMCFRALETQEKLGWFDTLFGLSM